jgi:hypothetical protein
MDGAAELARRLPPQCDSCDEQHEPCTVCGDGSGVLPKDRHAQRQLAAALFSSKPEHKSAPEDEPAPEERKSTPEERGKLRAKSYAIFGVDPTRAVVGECETLASDPAASEAVREGALSARESAQRAEHDQASAVRLCEELERVREMQRHHEHDLHLQKSAAEKASPPPVDRAPRPAARRTPVRAGRAVRRPGARRSPRATRAGPSDSEGESEPHRSAPALVATAGAGAICFAASQDHAIRFAAVVLRSINERGGLGYG